MKKFGAFLILSCASLVQCSSQHRVEGHRTHKVASNKQVLNLVFVQLANSIKEGSNSIRSDIVTTFIAFPQILGHKVDEKSLYQVADEVHNLEAMAIIEDLKKLKRPNS